MYFVYALSSIERNYIYVGLTDSVERRFSEHNSGKNKTTKPYLPFKIIFVEGCENRIEARKLEKYYKSGVGKEKLKVIRDQLNSCL
jgi:putative endonuclease